MTDNYDEFCKEKKCPEYIEWDYVIEPGGQPYPCVSCQKFGQSHNITDYPKDCLYLNEIQKIEIDDQSQESES